MKGYKELRLGELSVEQKLGLTMIAYLSDENESFNFAMELVKKHALGGIWVPPRFHNARRMIERIKDAADYPILVFTDAEGGIGEYMIGKHNAIGVAARPELSYTFGKVVGSVASEMGYNVVCDPVLDMVNGNMACAASDRSLGNDKEKVRELAISMVRGMHDGGVLSVAKHYPGSASGDYDMDSHMAETSSTDTKEELLDYNLYPYIALLREGLLDGIMTKHTRFENIDPDYPASLSEKVIGVIREEGFDGFAMTDALCMMGVLAKFGKTKTLALAIANGNDLSLPYNEDNRFCYEALLEWYNKGLIRDERLDEAVRRVLEAQHKVTKLPRGSVITDEDKANFQRINTDSIYAITDEGIEPSISRDGRHFFAVMLDQTYGHSTDETPAVDTITTKWYMPEAIRERLNRLFPNSRVDTIYELPTRSEVVRVLEDNLDYEDLIFITFFSGGPYKGREHFTPRILTVMDALQATDRMSTVVHLGNPYVLEDIPHVKRIIAGHSSSESCMNALDVLAGIRPALGKPTYDVKLK